jgi:superfamily I DNA/RNA helicase
LNAEVPLFNIAVPGSSKTFTLVERIAFLPSENGLTPEKIMVDKI